MRRCRQVTKIGLVTLVLGLATVCVSCTDQAMPSQGSSQTPPVQSTASAPAMSTQAASTAPPSTEGPELNPSATDVATEPTDLVAVTATSSVAGSDMGELIYVEYDQIWSVDPAGKGRKELIYEDGTVKEWPEFSPNQKWISYSAHHLGQDFSSLWVVNAEGGQAWQVSNEVALDRGWLPDNRLLFTEYPSYEFDPQSNDPPEFGTDFRTYIYDPETRALTEIAPVAPVSRFTDYLISPIEAVMAVVDSQREELLLMNLDSRDLTSLVRPYPMSEPIWSPDGRLLVYEGPARWYSVLYTVEVETGQVERLTSTRRTGSVDALSWSPDGAWIAFSGGGVCVLHVEDKRESCFEVRAPGCAGFPIPWSPDSSMIAVTEKIPPEAQDSTWDIYLIRVEDGHMTRLTNDASWEEFLLWRH